MVTMLSTRGSTVLTISWVSAYITFSLLSQKWRKKYYLSDYLLHVEPQKEITTKMFFWQPPLVQTLPSYVLGQFHPYGPRLDPYGKRYKQFLDRPMMQPGFSELEDNPVCREKRGSYPFLYYFRNHNRWQKYPLFCWSFSLYSVLPPTIVISYSGCSPSTPPNAPFTIFNTTPC